MKTTIDMKVLAVIAGLTLFAGLISFALATNLVAIAAIAGSLLVFAVMATAYLMRQSFAKHIQRSDDFHWY